MTFYVCCGYIGCILTRTTFNQEFIEKFIQDNLVKIPSPEGLLMMLFGKRMRMSHTNIKHSRSRYVIVRYGSRWAVWDVNYGLVYSPQEVNGQPDLNDCYDIVI